VAVLTGRVIKGLGLAESLNTADLGKATFTTETSQRKDECALWKKKEEKPFRSIPEL
jgi:hypothetical protein